MKTSPAEQLVLTFFFILLPGSVEFGPDVTSSDKSIKVMLNSQDKVRVI